MLRILVEHEANGAWADPECVVMDEWELAVNVLQDCVLVDEDWKFSDMTLDMPPERADELRQLLGIDRDYACDIPPDVDKRSARSVWADLVELVSGDRPDETPSAKYRLSTDAITEHLGGSNSIHDSQEIVLGQDTSGVTHRTAKPHKKRRCATQCK